MLIFEEIVFFKAMNNTKTNKSLSRQLDFAEGSARDNTKNKQITFLSVASWIQAEGTSSFCKNPTGDRKISDLFVFVLFVALKKIISPKNRILSCFV